MKQKVVENNEKTQIQLTMYTEFIIINEYKSDIMKHKYDILSGFQFLLYASFSFSISTCITAWSSNFSFHLNVSIAQLISHRLRALHTHRRFWFVMGIIYRM